METPIFIEQFQKDRQKELLSKNIDFNPSSFTLDSYSPGGSNFNTVAKSSEQEAYDQVDKLNQHIFEKHMSKIKQMMTIAILETQALLDTLYDQDKKFLQWKS